MSRIAMLLRTLLLLAIVCPGGCSKPASEPIRIAINDWPGYEFLYLADKKGFFSDEGVDVKLVEFMSLGDGVRSYERGQVDGMASTLIEVLQARDQSRRSPQIFMVLDISCGADCILARGGIKDVAGLRGKRVGLEVESMNTYVLFRALQQANMTLADVKIVSEDQASLVRRFKSGEIDAIVTYPPFRFDAQCPGAVKVFDTQSVPNEVVDVVAVEESMMKARPQDMGKIRKAFQRAVEYTRQHPEEAYQMMARREGVNPKEFATSLQTGVQMATPELDDAFFRKNGKLETAIRTTDEALREVKLLTGPRRTEGCLVRLTP